MIRPKVRIIKVCFRSPAPAAVNDTSSLSQLTMLFSSGEKAMEQTSDRLPRRWSAATRPFVRPKARVGWSSRSHSRAEWKAEFPFHRQDRLPCQDQPVRGSTIFAEQARQAASGRKMGRRRDDVETKNAFPFHCPRHGNAIP
jgi:hypothetical protein